MKIKYVQLESDAFLTDIDFVQFTSVAMTTEHRGGVTCAACIGIK